MDDLRSPGSDHRYLLLGEESPSMPVPSRHIMDQTTINPAQRVLLLIPAFRQASEVK